MKYVRQLPSLKTQAGFFAGLGFFFLLASAAQAQTPQQTPSPTAVLHTNARMVVVDVVVRNHNHAAVTDLKPSDFTLTDNGHPQSVRVFDQHGAEPDAPPPPPLPPGQFTNAAAINDGSLNIILLDLLNTRLTDQPFARDEAIAYLRKNKLSGRTAVFALTTRLLMLQGFSSDPSQLIDALSHKGTQHTQLLQAANDTSLDESTNESVAAATTAGFAGANAQAFENYTASAQKQMEVDYTLDGLNALARYLANFPGRKNLIWFSGGFPINILPNDDVTRDADPFAGAVSMEDEYRDTANLLSRARVAVYPIDSRGLEGFTNIGGSGAVFNRSSNKAQFMRLAQAHTTMNDMAEQTGGQAFYNTNSLSSAVAAAIADGSQYYSIAYSPTGLTDDGSFHSIRLKVDRPGVTLQYRRGYYADKPQAAAKTVAAANVPQDPALRIAMVHGGPPIDDLTFQVAVAPTNSPVHTTSQLIGLKQLTDGRPLRTFQVHFAVDPHHVAFSRVDPDHFRPEIRFIVFVYDRDGNLFQGYAQQPPASLTRTQIRTILQRGLQFPMDVDVPNTGNYFLRIAVEDRLSSHLGTLEVPIDPLRALPAVAALPQQARQ